MQPSKRLAAKMVIVLLMGIALPLSSGLSQTKPSGEASNQFEVFFKNLAAAQGGGNSRGETSYMELVDSLGTMTPAEVSAGIPVIDHQLDDTTEPQDLAKADAAMLLMFISWRPDGAQLLATQIDRLASMLNDPQHLLSGPAVTALQHIGGSRPDAVVPILESALKAPEANRPGGVGPGIATILLRMGPPSNQVVDDIVQYMRRTDLTETQLINTIVGIDSTRTIPDGIAAELVRCLDRPNEHIKSRARVGISRSSSTAKDAARARLQTMANDPNESAHARRLAAVALEGEITENPEGDK